MRQDPTSEARTTGPAPAEDRTGLAGPASTSGSVRPTYAARVGVGTADVTPAGPVVMSGFAARAEPSRGVHDPLLARALALGGPAGSPVLLVVVDVIGIDADLTRRVRRALWRSHGLPAERVALLATHTHGGPAVLRDAFLGHADEALRSRIVYGAVAAARRALDGMDGAELRWGQVEVPGVAVNRRVPGGPVDPDLRLLWAVRGGEVAAVLCSFALHPVVLGPDNLLLTRDFPGFLVDRLSASLRGAPVLFVNGCAGQVNHGHRAEESWSLARAATRTFAAAEAIGSRLTEAARSVVAVGGTPLEVRADVRAARRRTFLPFDACPGAADIAGERRRWRAELARPDLPAERRAFLDELVAWSERWMERRDGPALRGRWSEVQAFGVGGAALAFLPGEPFVETGRAVQRSAPGRVMTVGYANDAAGYLPTDAAMADGGYEVELAYRFYGFPSPYARGVTERLERAAADVVRRVTADRREFLG